MIGDFARIAAHRIGQIEARQPSADAAEIDRRHRIGCRIICQLICRLNARRAG